MTWTAQFVRKICAKRRLLLCLVGICSTRDVYGSGSRGRQRAQRELLPSVHLKGQCSSCTGCTALRVYSRTRTALYVYSKRMHQACIETLSKAWFCKHALMDICMLPDRCRLELTEEMLKVKQPPAVAVILPASGDIESGTFIATDEASGQLNPSTDLDAARTAALALQHHATAAQTFTRNPLCEEQSLNAPRAVVLTDTVPH